MNGSRVRQMARETPTAAGTPLTDEALFARLREHPDPDVRALAAIVAQLVAERDHALDWNASSVMAG